MINIEKLLNNYNDIPDLKVRKIKCKFNYVYILYIETICSSTQINDFILKNITNPNKEKKIENLLATPNFQKINLLL